MTENGSESLPFEPPPAAPSVGSQYSDPADWRQRIRLQPTNHFERSYSKAPKEIRAAFDKQSPAIAPEPPASFPPHQEIIPDASPAPARLHRHPLSRAQFAAMKERHILLGQVPLVSKLCRPARVGQPAPSQPACYTIQERSPPG
jgi:hypothetical protein